MTKNSTRNTENTESTCSSEQAALEKTDTAPSQNHEESTGHQTIRFAPMEIFLKIPWVVRWGVGIGLFLISAWITLEKILGEYSWKHYTLFDKDLFWSIILAVFISGFMFNALNRKSIGYGLFLILVAEFFDWASMGHYIPWWPCITYIVVFYFGLPLLIRGVRKRDKAKIFNRILVITTAIGILGLIAYTGHLWHLKQPKVRNHWPLSELLIGVEYTDGQWRILNTITNKKTERYDGILNTTIDHWRTYYNFVRTPDNSVIIVVKNDLRGYICATDGRTIFNPQFKYAWVADEQSGLAAAVDENLKLGFVNVRTGEIAIPFQFEFDENKLMYSQWHYDRHGRWRTKKAPLFDFQFRNGICIVPGNNGKLGIIDTNGNLLLPIEYSDIINWREQEKPYMILKKEVRPYSPWEFGEYLYGVVDRLFNTILPIEYDLIEPNLCFFDEVKNYIVAKDEQFGILDTLFRVILPLRFDNIEALDDSYIVRLNGRAGVLNSKFRTIIPTNYDEILLHDDEIGFLAQKDYSQKLYSMCGKLLHRFYFENDYEYDYYEEEYVEKPAFEPVFDPLGKLTNYIQYRFDGRVGILSGERIIIPAKHDQIQYMGNRTFVLTGYGYSYIFRVRFSTEDM